MGPTFRTEIETAGAGFVIHVYGEVDTATCGQLSDVIEPRIRPDRVLILDFSGVEFMDSSCLAVLIGVYSAATDEGGSLLVRNPSSIARRTLTIAGLEFMIEVDEGSPES